MTRILLHIGGEKTGSTYLQHWLHRNAGHLLRRHGTFYPTARPLCVRRAHFPLAASLLPPQARDFLPWPGTDIAGPLFAELQRQLRRSGAHTLLLSGEHFASRLDVAAIRRLRRLLGADEVQVLLYARWQDEVALSRFGTALRNGERGDFRPARIGVHERAYNPWRVACDWISVFGESQVRVRGYAEAARAGLACDLLDSLGLPSDGGWENVRRANERLDCSEARLLQLLNQHLPTWQEALRAGAPDQHRRAVRLRDLALRHYRARFRDGGAPLSSLLVRPERERLLARFADDNARLARQFSIAPCSPGTGPAGAEAPVPLCDRTLAGRLGEILDDAGMQLTDGRVVPRRPAALHRLRAAWRRHVPAAGARHRHGEVTVMSALATALTSLSYYGC